MRRWWPFVVGAVVALCCWRATCFLCDDAFIHFRYVANAYAGHGLVWNPPPFEPVEGYTSFLWPVLLLVVWRATGVEPPDSANVLAFCFALLTLALLARRLVGLRLPAAVAPGRAPLAAIVLAATASNYTWITWQSSGLETAMFGFFAVGWTLSIAGLGRPLRGGDLLRASGWAAMAQLTRPDGALLALGTLALAAHALLRGAGRRRAIVLALLPFALPAAHFVWRRVTYGEWLPNTYYAKVDEAWWRSGVRFLYCFALENGVFAWLLLALLWGGRQLVLPRLVRRVSKALPTAVVTATWCAHVGYYTLVVGGDHFGYRPFMPLVPLLFVSALAMGARLLPGVRRLVTALLLLAVAANAFGWLHGYAHRGEVAREFRRTAPSVPALVRAPFRLYDRCQAWMRLHFVATNRGQLEQFCNEMRAEVPPRGTPVVGAEPGTRLVFHTWAAGVVGWSLPDVAVIDMLGLSDWVIARSPGRRALSEVPAAMQATLFAGADVDEDDRLDHAELTTVAKLVDPGESGIEMSPSSWAWVWLSAFDREDDGLDRDEFAAMIHDGFRPQRLMNHSRVAPPGYAEALRSNVTFDGARFAVRPDTAPLTDREIVEAERRFRESSKR